MTLDQWEHLNDLVADALEQAPDARAAFVESRASAPGLATEALALLAAHDAAEAADALASPFAAAPLPDRVGPWRPTSRLGSGGMGVV